MKVKAVMSPSPIAVSTASSVREVANVMKEHQIDSVPVVNDDQRLIGIVTNNQLIDAVQQGLEGETPVNDIMDVSVKFIYEDEEAVVIFDEIVEKFPVLDRRERLVGMLTKTDLLKAYYTKYKNMATSMEALLESTNNGIVSTDPDGKVTIINKKAEQILKIEAAEVIGKPLNEALPNTQIRNLIESGSGTGGKAIECNGMSLIVNRTPIQLEGREIGAVAVLNDITDYHSAMVELTSERNTSEILKTIMDIAYDGIVVVDEEGYITMLSKEYAKFLGVSEKEVIGKHVSDVIENTRMHLIVKTGKPEIASLQKIKGNYMIATRIPIIKNGVITGAVGKVLFRNLSDLNSLHRQIRKMEKELEQYRGELKEINKAKYQFDNLIGESEQLEQAKKIAERAALTDSNVLLLGESGTGKELFAHAIHNASTRSFGAFVKVNCAAIPADLLESELFGYEEGSFTGARKGGKKGKFEAADGGTIFLDEIGELPIHMQVKLLRVLQEREVEKIGATSSKSIDVRIIAATNRNLEEMVDKGEFRVDLFYRLNVITVNIPSLRDRAGDTLLLARYLVNKLSGQLNKQVGGIGERTAQYLMNYGWPGNVRELENVLERAINLIDAGESIQPEHLPEKVTGTRAPESVSPLELILEETEKQAIMDSLQITNGNKTKAARLLHISRSTLYEKMNKHGITEGSEKLMP
ncbi:sigma 54-interacting transcriptional regulator [Bacillus marinisedimentorum]|uniref:sigma 54-interacting transcriptional regulator n=1 Tax=Bacillus marinisedimentorum TaxID=1821260 RepID=UPI0009F5ADEA|nr:sigma 54-interacting transcriptional regulator [Bacillus marinisedimentorum]